MVGQEIQHFGRLMMPEITCFVSDSKLQRILDRAAAKAGFDPDRSNAVDAIGRTSAPVLLVHGTDDWVAPYWNSVMLQQAAPDHSERIPIAGGGHVSLWFDCDGRVSSSAILWFDQWLTAR